MDHVRPTTRQRHIDAVLPVIKELKAAGAISLADCSRAKRQGEQDGARWHMERLAGAAGARAGL